MNALKIFSIARKAGVGTLGVVATALSMGILPDPWDKVAVAVLAVCTHYGVYKVANSDFPTPDEAP